MAPFSRSVADGSTPISGSSVPPDPGAPILSRLSRFATQAESSASEFELSSDPRPIRIVIAGGGTGGHVLPAVSVIEELKRREVQAAILWIGSHAGVERSAAERMGIPFTAIATGKFRRYLDRQTATDALRVPLGVAQAWRQVRAFKPDVVFSTGGFVSVPTVIAAARIAPILTHEQTTAIGLATKINARFADVLALS